MKKPYVSPKIDRIQLEDKELLSLGTACKDPDEPVVPNCCIIGDSTDCELPGTGGLPGGVPASAPGS